MKHEFKKIPKSIWALGLVSLLMDISSEAVYGLLPVFLVSVLNASYTTVGLIEGFGEAAALAVRIFSGPLSDWWGRRKPLALLGYTMGAISKPFFALAWNPYMVFGARFFDRIGKGIRSAPRDALIADITPSEIRGQAFGLRQSLDTVGAFVGPLLAIALMAVFHGNYRLVFWVAVIPAALSAILLFVGVKEPETKIASGRKISFRIVKDFQFSFWVVVLAGGFFQLSRFSEAFLILRAQNLGLSLGLAPLVLVMMNVVYALSAYPFGKLSDRVRREWLIIAGFLVLILADLFLAMGNHLAIAFAGVMLWGVHLGLTQGVLAALVADTCSPSYRGTAYGIFNLFSAGALLIASVVAGFLWDQYGPSATFFVSGLFALIGVVILTIFRKHWSSESLSN